LSASRPVLHHIALTVTDLEKSIPWYEKLFAIRYQFDGPHERGTGKLLADDDWRLVITLHRHDDNQGEAFTETRTGLGTWKSPPRFAASSCAESCPRSEPRMLWPTTSTTSP